MTMDERWQALDAERAKPFGTLPDLVRVHAGLWPEKAALVQDGEQLDYATLDRLVDRAAAAMQRDGIRAGDVVAICSLNSIRYAVAFVAALRAGAAVAPLAPLTTPQALGLMLDNCDAKILFADGAGNGVAAVEHAARSPLAIGLDDATPFHGFDQWLAPEGTAPAAIPANPEAVFNIIYSSGTTGTPKGIVHTNQLRWPQICSITLSPYQPDSVTIISTPLYSNTTLVSFLPALGCGGTVVLMKKLIPPPTWRWRKSTASPTPCWCRCSIVASWSTPTSTATTCRASGSSSAPARRFPPPSRPRCCGAGPGRWSSSTA